jgi:hypothetical protein
MPDVYEQFADVFLSSMSGQMAGLSRDEVIAMFRKKWPNAAEFEAMIQTISAQAQDTISQAQAQLKPGEVLAVGYPVDKRGHIIRKAPLN